MESTAVTAQVIQEYAQGQVFYLIYVSPHVLTLDTSLADRVIDDYCTLASCVIIFHEYLVTLNTELEVIWRRKLTSWTTISLWYIAEYWLPTPASDVGCAYYTTVLYTSQLISYAVWPSLSALRVYSVAKQRIYLNCATFCLGLLPFGTNMASMTQLEVLSEFEWPIHAIRNGQCNTAWGDTGIGANISYFSQRAAEISHLRGSLRTLFVRDGAIYFVIASIIVSRFILNIRETHLMSTRHPCALWVPPVQPSSAHSTSFEDSIEESQCSGPLQSIGLATLERKTDLNTPT
ncbi:hypothetical protein OBBRIDRAFT_804002 [Obba rivulosa]|uniref:DUF6533 domain-containing protein n=1 Tax=Obba rivulosa TaxID=1052685 RepID=A0A8E2DNL9_9APHY|nr:hypothetical protein OBBRIDRAFT_804002 [Obba rivulosa]